MGGLSIWHWIIVLVVVLLVFGTKRLRNAGQDLGEAVKGFKKGMKDDDAPASWTTSPAATKPAPPKSATATPADPAGLPPRPCSISASVNCWSSRSSR